jgi:hypothetical protein
MYESMSNMDKKPEPSSPDRSEKRRQKTKILIIIIIAVMFLAIVWCCGLPNITGQSCIDFASGKVPPKAEEMFFNMLFEATINEDDDLLDKLTTEYALEDIIALRPVIETKYTVLGGDDLGGTYDRLLQFDNGVKIDISYWGIWPICPDFRITRDEVIENLQLLRFRLLDEN